MPLKSNAVRRRWTAARLLALLCASNITLAAPGSIDIVPGWNLVGNGVEAPLALTGSFGDTTKVMSVWKWVAAGATPGIVYPTWALYSPILEDGGKSYAASKGYDFLTSISAGEGFWVNAKAGFSAPLPAAAAVVSSSFKPSIDAVAGGAHALPHGWSLIAAGDNPLPAQFNATIAGALASPPQPGQVTANLISLWSWDARQANWSFWSPDLAAGGELTSYLKSKNYLDFAAKLSPTQGVWVNLRRAPTLSETQKNFESMALAANGGLYSLSGQLTFSGSSSPAPGSYFDSLKLGIAQSAADSPQKVVGAESSLTSTLTPKASSGKTRYLIDGVVLTAGSSSYGYVNSDVLFSVLATDGKTLYSILDSRNQVVGLSGAIANSPSEVFANSALGLLTNTINGVSPYDNQATWRPGSAYMRATRQTVGDSLVVADCIAPATTGPNITPCSTAVATLEDFFPYKSSTTTYAIDDGRIVTLAGVRAWVAHAALTSSPTLYRVFYQNNGKIYVGTLTKAGSPLQKNENISIYFNHAAIESIKSALAF